MTTRLPIVVALIAAAALALPPPPAAAQVTRSLGTDPSARSAGMGGASTAVHWSGDVNGWANPALLGYASGFRYGWESTKMLPQHFRRGVTFQTHGFRYGWGGVGLAVESRVLKFGRVEMTDAQGIPIGLVEETQDIRPLGGGISISRALESVASLRGVAAPGFTRYADVAVGFTRTRVRFRLAHSSYPPEARPDANDFGVLVRATPLARSDTGRPFLDLIYGFAQLNHNDVPDPNSLADLVPNAYITGQSRHGIAVRFGFPLTQGAAEGLERRFGRWIARGMGPLVSVAVAADFSRYRIGPDQPFGTGVDQVGVELVLANTLAARFGHVREEFFGVEGYSFGLGLGVSLADFAGARYDYAGYPQASGHGMRDHHAVATWFDPVAFVRR